MNYLEIRNVSKTYGDKKVLDDISLSVPRQSIYGLLGHNGAGKTTLIRILNQITLPDSGQILLEGKPMSQNDIALIGYLPEERGLYKKMKVGEQAIYLAQLKGLPRKEAERRIRRWFIKFDIINWWDKRVEELSKGMQQKIQFIVTVIHEPKLIVFDEPFSGFDPINVNILKNEILELRDKGATILFSTHNMASVEELCDNIMLINKGVKILEGSVYDIKQRFKGNNFEIVLKPFKESIDIPQGHTIISMDNTNNGQVRIVLQTNMPNELIRSLLDEGDLISFHEILPSMNEIFINLVSSSNKS
ncbi:MAG: ABC transporter ATP-binding protein [Candidatus Limimorpha sp.]